MLVSYSWLGRHVDLTGISAEEVARDLTLHTAEVEGVEPFLPHLTDVTVGHVVTREKHPDADKLSVCTVDVGNGEPLGIVCGAPNVRAGLKVAVATVGTVLPGDFKIKKSKIRGQASVGMICSERELGLGDEHTGIWELPEDVAIGEPVSKALGAEDWLIEIDNKSLTHRPDLWGHRGIAGEIAAIRGLELEPLDLTLPATGNGEAFPVRVEDGACSRYLALPIDGVKPVRSPDWLRRLLLAVGQRPLDLLVDVSNFVMLDLGQPNHLFDRGSLAGGIVVRKARSGERMTTLDEVERKLEPDDLLICSGEKPVALAGIMGGHESEVAEGTSELLLEVATFDPTVVRRTSARLGLRSEASARFEKSLDPTLPLKAAAHLVRLLAQLQPDLSLPAPLTDAGEWTDPAFDLTLRGDRARAVLGVDLSDADMADMLGRLGFGAKVQGGGVAVRVPSARATKDVAIEEDLIEEVGRLHRYDRIPERALEGPILPALRDDRRTLVRRLQDELAGGARYHEAMTYSFVADEICAAVGESDGEFLSVRNPVAEGVSRIRRSVVPSLLGVVRDNLRRTEAARLFEVGKGYLPDRRDERGQPAEVHELALVVAAPTPPKGARFDATSLLELRGTVDRLMQVARRPALNWSHAEEAPSWAHPGRAMVGRVDGSPEIIALLAEVEPGVALALELGQADAAAGVLDLDRLLDLPTESSPYRPIPRFPGVKLDVAFACPVDLPAGELRALIEKSGKGLVASVELFDVYAGPNLGEGKKSLAWHVVLQAADRTLTDKDQAKVLARLERAAPELGAELRSE